MTAISPPKPNAWQVATVTSIRDETPRVKTIQFTPGTWSGHLPGQRAEVRLTAGDGYATATDLADWLVRELNLPFRQAHHVTGAAVKRAEALGVDLSQLPLAELQSLEAGVTEAVYKVLTPEASCASRQSFGGTAPEQVRARIAEWKTRL